MYNRRALKKAGRQTIKKHYWMLLLICLFAAVIGTSFSDDLAFLTFGSANVDEIQDVIEDTKDKGINGIIKRLVVGDEKGGQKIVDAAIKNEEESSEKIGVVEVGRKSGFLATAINTVSSGKLFMSIYQSAKSLTGSYQWGVGIAIVIAMLIYLLMFAFIQNVYEVVAARLILEGRTYKKVPFGRAMFIFRAKRWRRTAWTMLLKFIYHSLWSLTIVGYFIKRYSYSMVPYIVAENPDIKANEAITLSRKMMDGHKMQKFVLDLSFWYWHIVNFFTLGLFGVLFLNPYTSSVDAEYYSYIRDRAFVNHVENSKVLNDKYLFTKASEKNINQAYSDIIEKKSSFEMPEERKGFWGFLENTIGLVLIYDDKEKEYRRAMQKKNETDAYEGAIKGEEYPLRMNPIMMDKGKKTDTLIHTRHYSLLNVIMIFFIVCFIGWIWEVTLHLISEGVFINRGTLYGPWLPIYGSGGVAILLLLHKFKTKSPGVVFALSFIICGVIEYVSGWSIEHSTGLRYWDYRGHFLNINGYVCAEGLLIFGLAGVAGLFLLFPILDNFLMRIPFKVALPMVVAVIAIFIADNIYSKKVPNVEGMSQNARIDYLNKHPQEKAKYYKKYPQFKKEDEAKENPTTEAQTKENPTTASVTKEEKDD